MISDKIDFMLLGYCVRMFLISVPGQLIGLAIAGTMLKRRRSTAPVITFLIIKFVILGCILNTYLKDQLQNEPWFELTCLIIGACSAVIVAFLFYLTFYGSAIKCITAMNISEILASVIMLPAVIIINIFQKRENVFLFVQPLKVSDFLLPVSEAAFFLLFYRLTKNFLEKYRSYQLKYPKLWWTIYLVYFCLLQFTSIIDYQDNDTFMLFLYMVFLVCAILGTFAFFLMYLRYLWGIQLERAYLNTQLGLLETHYQAIQSQVQQMESCQKMIAQQMEELTAAKEEGALGKHTKEYLHNLKEEYGKLRAGMYCDDWRIDAVLYCQIEAARSQGIEVDCQIKGYDRGMVDQQVVSQLLFLLLHNAVCIFQEENLDKRIRLRADYIKGSFVISFWMSHSKIEKLVGKQMKKLVKETGGMLDLEMEGNSSSVVITFG